MARYEEAVTDLTRAIDLDPGLAWAITERGETYRRMERYDQALTDFRRAMDLDPSLADWVGTYLAKVPEDSCE